MCIDHTTTSINSAVGGDEAIVSPVICAPCDNACADCSGPGPENCTSCAEGYEAGQTMSSNVILCVRIPDQYPKTDNSILLVLGVMCSLLVLLVVAPSIGLLLRKRRRKSRGNTSDTVLGASSSWSLKTSSHFFFFFLFLSLSPSLSLSLPFFFFYFILFYFITVLVDSLWSCLLAHSSSFVINLFTGVSSFFKQSVRRPIRRL